HFVGDIVALSGVDGIEIGQRNFLAGGDAAIDLVDFVFVLPKGLERFVGDGETKSFGSRFGDALTDFIIFTVLKPLGDLIDFLICETGECALFSHKFRAKKAKSTTYEGKWTTETPRYGGR